MTGEQESISSETTENLLDDALARGIISDKQRSELAGLKQADELDQDERIKGVSKFNEVFMTVGVAVLLFAVNGLLAIPFSETVSIGLIAGFSLLVGEYFHGKKRHRLPIAYCVIYAAFLVSALLEMVNANNGYFLRESSSELAQILGAVAVLVAGAARFRIPFLMLPIMVLAVLGVTTLAATLDVTTSLRVLLGISGLLILVIAVRFDLKDPARTARASDFAFWSYMVGSPLFVHALLLPVIVDNVQDGELAFHYWLLLVVLIALVSFAGLLMNRRALVISTMAYVGFLIAYFLIKQNIASPQIGLLAAMASIGSYMLFLGSRWSRFRRMLLQKLSAKYSFVQHLPRY